jgi:hypothetical protein
MSGRLTASEFHLRSRRRDGAKLACEQRAAAPCRLVTFPVVARGFPCRPSCPANPGRAARFYCSTAVARLGSGLLGHTSEMRRLRSSAEHCSPKRQFFIPPFSHLAWWCTCVPYELLVRQPFIRRLHCACTHAPCHLSNKSSTRSANKAFALEEESLICSTIKNTRMGVGAFRPVPVV